MIFDWDDTLFPSSWVAERKLRLDGGPLDADTRASLRALEAASLALLSAALESVDRVIVITNAERGWVELSASRFVPGLLPYLSRITIVSARSDYESRYPDDPLSWKMAAFTDMTQCVLLAENKGQGQGRITSSSSAASPDSAALAASASSASSASASAFLADGASSVISLGDSVHERHALLALKQAPRSIANCAFKSIKFFERPSCAQLTRQINAMVGSLQNVCAHEGERSEK